MTYEQIKDLVRFLARDYHGIKLTDPLIQDLIIRGQRYIMRKLRMREYQIEHELTYTADADSMTVPNTIAWVSNVKEYDSTATNPETPIPVIYQRNHTLMRNQLDNKYIYVVGRELHLRPIPSVDAVLKLFCVPLIAMPETWSWTQDLDGDAGRMYEMDDDLLIHYIMWKILMYFSPGDQTSVMRYQMWRQEFYALLSDRKSDSRDIIDQDLYMTKGHGVIT